MSDFSCQGMTVAVRLLGEQTERKIKKKPKPHKDKNNFFLSILNDMLKEDTKQQMKQF